jgi:hypothetical protein
MESSESPKGADVRNSKAVTMKLEEVDKEVVNSSTRRSTNWVAFIYKIY